MDTPGADPLPGYPPRRPRRRRGTRPVVTLIKATLAGVYLTTESVAVTVVAAAVLVAAMVLAVRR